MRVLPALCLAALLVLAGCTAPVHDGGPASPADGDGTPATADGTPAEQDGTSAASDDGQQTGQDDGRDGSPVGDNAPPDPRVDRLGWEAGYWHNESIDVNQSDGLSDAEMEAFVSRAMARVEVIRRLEFAEDVPVEVVSREEYRRNNQWVRDSPSYSAWNNQVWEALFVVDEETDVTDELAKLYGSNVLGFYLPSEDRLVVVSDGSGPPVMNNATLVHELVHALQDQQFDLTDSRYAGRTQDAELAGNGLTEGEANYVETLYARRCGDGWRCVPPRTTGGGSDNASSSSSGRINLGLLVTVLHPYSDGPVYVDHLVDAGGWAAVDDAHADPPASTEQVIHPGRDDEPVDVTVADRARDGWTRFEYGVDGADTVGEASIATMFWYQATHYRANVTSVGGLFETEGPFDTYNYDFPPSAGWAGDGLVPYRRGGEYGYVWATEWDSLADASEFVEAYREVLRAHGAERRGAYTWVVPEGGFSDAFHVRQDGTRVTVVNAPTVGELDEIRPGIETGPVPADGNATA